MNIISSRQHPLCKRVRELHSSKGRRKRKSYLIEGGNGVGAAIQARAPIEQILVAPDRIGQEWQELASAVSVPIQWVEDDLLAYLSEAQSAPDVMAIAPLPNTHSDWELNGMLLVLDGIGDPGNAGTLLRAADASGAQAVIFTRGSVDAFSPKVIRAAAGSSFHLPRWDLDGLEAHEIVQVLAERNIPIITAQAHNGTDAFDFAWPTRCALVLGHETRGISKEFEAAARTQVTLPLYGRAESLNVAMAGTLLLYAWRQNQS